MAFCSKCGGALVEGRAFCGSCGAPVGAGASSSTAPPPGAPVPGADLGGSAPQGLRAGPYDDPDRYELNELRSRGGEGELWRSTLSIDGVPLPVAVKVINEANNERIDDWSRRWNQQAEILRTLDHPSLVKVRDTFEGPLPHPQGGADPSSRSLFLVMNWVKGDSLVEWVARNPERDLLDSTRVIARIAAAVDYLHSGASTGKAVLHRDIKPANVLIDGSAVCLVDFGFARLMSGEPMTLAGTPYYLAPEVVGGGTFSEASDRYALGATAYYTIVGEPPTPGDYPGMRAKLAAARGAEGRTDLAEHVLAMMAQDPARRPANTVEWAQALAAGAVSTTIPMAATAPATGDVSAAPPPPRKRRRKLVATLVIVLLLLAAAGAGAAYLFLFKGDDPVDVVASPSPTPSVAPTPSPSVTYSTSPEASPSPDTSPAPDVATDDGLTHMNLSQLAEPLNGSVDEGEYTMQTESFFYSIGYSAGDYDDATQSVEYNVPAGFDTFRATIGMDDSSGSSAKTTFQVIDPITGNYLFGGPGDLVTLKVNQVREIEIPLSPDTLRIKLTTISHANEDDWWQVGVVPVWGDAEFSGPQGTAVLPTPPAE